MTLDGMEEIHKHVYYEIPIVDGILYLFVFVLYKCATEQNHKYNVYFSVS